MGKTNFFLSTLPFNPWASFSHMATCKSSLEDTRKLSLIPVFNKKFPWAHTESEFDVWCLWKACEICSSLVQKKKIEKKLKFFT
jgi:hypothetical protein